MMNKKTLSRIQKGLLLSAVVVSLSACSTGKWGFPYVAPVQQGNWITADQVALLQKGMTPDQVRYALGSPTLMDVLHPNIWQYPFYFKPGYGNPVTRNFVVVFNNNVLERWAGDKEPDYQPFQRNDISRPNVEAAREAGEQAILKTKGQVASDAVGGSIPLKQVPDSEQ